MVLAQKFSTSFSGKRYSREPFRQIRVFSDSNFTLISQEENDGTTIEKSSMPQKLLLLLWKIKRYTIHSRSPQYSLHMAHTIHTAGMVGWFYFRATKHQISRGTFKLVPLLLRVTRPSRTGRSVLALTVPASSGPRCEPPELKVHKCSIWSRFYRQNERSIAQKLQWSPAKIERS